MEIGSGPQTAADVVSDLLLALDEQLVAHAQRELRMAELGNELPRRILEARDVVDEVARVCLAEPGKKLAKFAIIHTNLRLDYKVATHPCRADALNLQKDKRPEVGL